MVCTSCGDTYDGPGTTCDWCKEHARAQLKLGGAAPWRGREPTITPDDLSLSEALQWGAENGAFVDA